MAHETGSDLLTTEEARRLKGLRTRKTIATAIRQRRLRAVRRGRVWMVRLSDLKAFRPSYQHQENALSRRRPR